MGQGLEHLAVSDLIRDPFYQQSTSGGPCGRESGMAASSWPQEQEDLLPRSLQQLIMPLSHFFYERDLLTAFRVWSFKAWAFHLLSCPHSKPLFPTLTTFWCCLPHYVPGMDLLHLQQQKHLKVGIGLGMQPTSHRHLAEVCKMWPLVPNFPH